MSYPFISIIVPVYNVEAYLHECIKSILKWKENWELILVNDGSLDNCPKICDEYALKNERVKVIHQKNNGVAKARNAGLDIACGEWIWFVDADDFIDYKNTHLLIDKIHGKGYDYIQFGHFRINNETGEKTVVKVSESIGLDKNTFFLKNLIYTHWSVWYKRDIIEKHRLRFTNGLRMAEDLEFMYLYQLYTKNPVQINLILYYYRLRNNSAAHNSNTYIHGVKDSFCVLDNWLKLFQKENIEIEPWFDTKVLIFIKRLLYYAWHTSDLNKREFQRHLRLVIDRYKAIGFSFPYNKRIRIASCSIYVYFLLNKIYLRLRGLE